MARSFRASFLLCVVLLGCASRVGATTIDFESFSDSESLVAQVPGLTFSNATVLAAGIGLNESEFPPRSGSKVAFDDGGALSIAFASPVINVSGYFNYVQALTLQAFDAGNALVATTDSVFGSNLALSGDAGSSSNELLQVAFVGGIASVVITGAVGGGSFTLDDLTFTPAQNGEVPVPEPGTLSLLLLGGAGLVRNGRRRQRVPR